MALLTFSVSVCYNCSQGSNNVVEEGQGVDPCSLQPPVSITSSLETTQAFHTLEWGICHPLTLVTRHFLLPSWENLASKGRTTTFCPEHFHLSYFRAFHLVPYWGLHAPLRLLSYRHHSDHCSHLNLWTASYPTVILSFSRPSHCTYSLTSPWPLSSLLCLALQSLSIQEGLCPLLSWQLPQLYHASLSIKSTSRDGVNTKDFWRKITMLMRPAQSTLSLGSLLNF